MKKIIGLATAFTVFAAGVALFRSRTPEAASQIFKPEVTTFERAVTPQQAPLASISAVRDVQTRRSPRISNSTNRVEAAPREHELDEYSPFRAMTERRAREYESFAINVLRLEPAQREALDELLARRTAARLDRVEGRISDETLQGDLENLEQRLQDLIGERRTALLNEFNQKQSVDRARELVSLIPPTEGVKHEFRTTASLPPK